MADAAGRGPRVGRLLLVVHAVILLLPVAVFGVLRLLDRQLVQQEERRLLAESAWVAEVYRDAWLRAAGEPADAAPEPPPWAEDDRYWPLEPRIRGVLPPEPPVERVVEEAARQGPAWEAGASITPVLERAQRASLAGIRVLGPDGCVVASSGSQLGDCLSELAEVRAAREGRYGAVGRERISDEPPPPLGGLRRRGDVRLFVAVPVVHDGAVIGIARLSRTARDPLEVAWDHRAGLGVAVLLGVLVTAGLSGFLSRWLVRPLRRLTDEARAVAAGEDRQLTGGGPAEVGELAEALERMRGRLSEQAERVVREASEATHELKTPIAGIRGAAELLRDSWDAMQPTQRERFLSNIDGDAARLEKLVAGLLELTRVRERAPKPELISVEELARELEGRWPGLRTEVEEGLTVTMDRERLTSALNALLENAWQHGEEPVRFVGRRAGERVRFEVRDGGPGIKAEDAERIWERFVTTARDQGGTGLGLALVKAVVEAEGGEVGVEGGGVWVGV